jgi:hypothetical protein
MKIVILGIVLVVGAGMAALANTMRAVAPPAAQATPSTIDPLSVCSGPRIAQGGEFQQCFSPALMAQKEKVLPFRVISPVQSVWHLLHLKLTEGAQTWALGSWRNGALTPTAKALTITYVFGRLPRLPGSIPDSGGQSKYMVVTESAGHNIHLTKSRQVQIVDATMEKE